MDNSKLSTIVFIHTPYTTQGSTAQKEIEIKNVLPDELGYSYKPNFTAQNILGRMSPIQMYSGGSDIKYSFTLTIHEDMLLTGDMRATDKYTNIIDFVDDLKALAYPYLDDSGLLRAPKIYFQIGDILGNGFVKVNASWKKPFRRGHYIMADISFDLTVTEKYPAVQYDTEEIESGVDTTYLVYNDTVRLTDRESELILAIGTFTGFELSIGDFITSDNISSDEKRSNLRFTSDTFDYSQQKFRDLLTMMEKMSPNSEIIDNIQEQVNGLDDFININISTPTLVGVTVVVEALKLLKTSLVDYIEGEYYLEVNKELLAEERDALIVDVSDRIDALITLYEEVSGYGITG